MLNKIPEQLKDCFFCKINRGQKGPFEKNWQNKIYSYDLISMYFPELNYGVLTGINELGILDDDTEDKRLMKLYENNFPETFRVRGHYYIKLKGWDGKKIIFYEGNEHLGELQGKGQQAVGPGSLHPSGEFYEVIKDIPIIEIDFDRFKEVFKKYMREQKEYTEISISDWEGDDINTIPISDVLFPTSAVKKGSTYQGAHPIHGSSTGMNFSVDTHNNQWYCFRCGTGGGIWTAIAITEGILSCSNCRNYTLSDSEKKQVIEIARDKYRLKKPKKKVSEELKFQHEFDFKKEKYLG